MRTKVTCWSSNKIHFPADIDACIRTQHFLVQNVQQWRGESIWTLTLDGQQIKVDVI